MKEPIYCSGNCEVDAPLEAWLGTKAMAEATRAKKETIWKVFMLVFIQ